MSNALNSGWRRSIWGILGQQAALVVHIVIVGAGVGLFVSRSPILFDTIRYLGAAYLAYLGLRMFFARVPDTSTEAVAPAARKPEHGFSMFRRGFWVNLLNPKAIVFFLAFIPPFIQLGQPALPQYLVIGATAVIVDIIVMWGFFASAARPFRRLTRTRRGQQALNRVFGVLFLGVAVLLLFVH